MKLTHKFKDISNICGATHYKVSLIHMSSDMTFTTLLPASITGGSLFRCTVFPAEVGGRKQFHVFDVRIVELQTAINFKKTRTLWKLCCSHIAAKMLTISIIMHACYNPYYNLNWLNILFFLHIG